MPTGRPDYWYGTALYFEDSPADGEVTRGPTSNWAHDHAADANAHHTPTGGGDIDHADLANVLAGQHHVKYLNSEAVSAMGAKADANPLHHDRYDEKGLEGFSFGKEGTQPAAKTFWWYTYNDVSYTAFFKREAGWNGNFTFYQSGNLPFLFNIAGTIVLRLLAAGGVEEIWDDTPTNGQVTKGVTSDWAYDHVNNTAAHHSRYLDSEAVTAMGAKGDANPLHHDKAVSGDIDHGSIGGLTDDDHSQYLHTSVGRVMTTGIVTDDVTFWHTGKEGGVAKFYFLSLVSGNLAFRIYYPDSGTPIFDIDLSGNISRVGTVDGVDVSAHAANASAHHAKTVSSDIDHAGVTNVLPNQHHTPPVVFVDRGDAVAYDVTEAQMTMNGQWHDWDFSAIVPAGAIAVLLKVNLTDNTAGAMLMFRKNGNSNIINTSDFRVVVANQPREQDMIVACDANRVIEYLASEALIDVNMGIRGWWI